VNRMDEDLTYTGEDLKIMNFKPDYNMIFSNDDGEVGKMDWNDGTFKFSGDADESAKVFLGFLKPYLDEYVANKLKDDAYEVQDE